MRDQAYQIVLYIYSLSTDSAEKPQVKIGQTSGSTDANPEELADQCKNSIPSPSPKLLGAVPVPSESIETAIYSKLKSESHQIQDLDDGCFEFPSSKKLEDFLDEIYRAVIVNDFSDLGAGRTDIQGDSFNSIIEAFGVKKFSGSQFKEETELIKIIDRELSSLYPNFPRWFYKTMEDSNTVFNVAYRAGKAIGVAIWKLKNNNIAKLSTLFVVEEYRSLGIGRNLILTCLKQWENHKIKRAFVTTAKPNLIKFFERYGFWLEGIGREIYERDEHQPEFFLTKLLFYEDDQNDNHALHKGKILFPSITKTYYKRNTREEVSSIKTEEGVIELYDSEENPIYQFDLHDWLNLIYPAYSLYAPEIAHIIPIKPQYLIQIFQAGKTVYYGKPSATTFDIRGALIVFYASAPISGAVAVARVVNRYINSPTELYNQLGNKGVLSLEEVGTEGQQRQAIEFDYLMPLYQEVSLEQLKSEDILKGPPQSMHRLDLERYQKIVDIGGIYEGSVC